MSLFQLESVQRYYPDGDVYALRDVSLTIHPGEYISIEGQSGSGKSTLLNLLGGLDLPTSGEIHYQGQSLAEHPDLTSYRMHEIGFVFQSYHLLSNLTACENVALALLDHVETRVARKKAAMELLERVGLHERASHRPAKLSVGQRQRVAIARALTGDPAVILADEPTGALDSQTGIEVMEMLESLQSNLVNVTSNASTATDEEIEKQVTLIVVTHDAQIASRANRSIRVVDGRVADEIL